MPMAAATADPGKFPIASCIERMASEQGLVYAVFKTYLRCKDVAVALVA